MSKARAGKLLIDLLSGAARTARDYATRGGMAAGIGRTSEDEVRRRIARDLPDIIDRARSSGGFTADVSSPLSRRGSAFVPAGRRGYGGYMMAPRPEVAGSRIPSSATGNQAAMEQALRNLMDTDPQLMDDLIRGRYLGGWYDEATGELVVDPSRRYMTRAGSMRAGERSGQKAGFDVRRDDEYRVQPGVPSTIGRVAGGAGAAAAGAELIRRILEEDR